MAHTKHTRKRGKTNGTADDLSGKKVYFIGSAYGFGMLSTALQSKHPGIEFIDSHQVPAQFSMLTADVAEKESRHIAAMERRPDMVVMLNPGVDMQHDGAGFDAACFPLVKALHKQKIPSLIVEPEGVVNCTYAPRLSMFGASYSGDTRIPQVIENIETVLAGKTVNSPFSVV